MATTPTADPVRDADRPLRGLVLRFVVSGATIVLLLALVVVWLLGRYARTEAVRDAKVLTQSTARGIVEPALDDADLAPGSVSGSFLDRLVRQRVRFDPVVRVKVWRADGTIAYSDDHRLVGRRFRLGADELAVLRHGGVVAEVSDLSKPENRYEHRSKKLLEVYLRVHTHSGTPLLYESYLRYSSVEAGRNRALGRLVPAFLGALVLLELLQVPLAMSLARRLDANRHERERLLQRAVDASAMERRRIARDLHDGVVQRLAGVSLGLHALSRGGHDIDATAIGDASAEVRTAIGELRTLLVEIYPPSLQDGGLQHALDDLVGGLGARGIDARVDADLADAGLSRGAEAMLFRVAQEAVRNAQRHASASSLVVAVQVTGGTASISVRDDGVGFDTTVGAAEGHVGLELARDLVTSAGGELQVTSAPGEGTTILATVPVDA